MNGLTVEELYEAYMEDDPDAVPFAEKVYGYFGGRERFGTLSGEFGEDYQKYFTEFDPVKVELAEREKQLAFEKASDIEDITSRTTDLAYATESAKISSNLQKELREGREMVGRLGLRSGDVESAIDTSITSSSNKVRDLGDRYKIQKEETKNVYDTSLVDATLDFDKSEREAKEDFYQRTLKTFDKLVQMGALSDTMAKIGSGGKDLDYRTEADNADFCVEALGPAPVPGSPEFDEQYELLQNNPTTSYWSKVADCRGKPFSHPDPPSGDEDVEPTIFPNLLEEIDVDIGGGGFSDIRLKENVEYIGNSPSGLKMYEFDYIYKPGRYRGVMANDMLDSSAVIMGNDGYYRVDYSKIDVNFERID